MQLKFSLVEVYYDFWFKLVERYGLFCEKLCSQHVAKLISQEWVGMYKNVEDMMPEWVVCAGYLKAFSFGLVEFSAEFMGTFPNPLLGCNTSPLMRCNPIQGMFYLLLLSQDECLELGWMNSPVEVHVLNSTCSLVNWISFFFDPARWWWPGVTPFMTYSTKLGRTWITS